MRLEETRNFALYLSQEELNKLAKLLYHAKRRLADSLHGPATGGLDADESEMLRAFAQIVIDHLGV